MQPFSEKSLNAMSVSPRNHDTQLVLNHPADSSRPTSQPANQPINQSSLHLLKKKPLLTQTGCTIEF